MNGQDDRGNAMRLLKALIARGANSKEPMPNAWITQVALEIGLRGDELDSAANQVWFEDAEVDDDASWLSLTPAGESASESE